MSGQILSLIAGVVIAVPISLLVARWLRRSEERAWERPPLPRTPDDADTLVGYDRRSRPYLRIGRLAWSGMALWAITVVPFGLLIATRPWGVDGNRWVGGVWFVITAGFWSWWFVHFLRRWRRYLDELRRRGQRHKQPTAPAPRGPA